jgi:hypothetical protein
MGFIPRIALLASAAWCAFAADMFIREPHFTADPEFKGVTAQEQADETIDKVLYSKPNPPPGAKGHEDRWEPENGMAGMVILAGAMYASVASLFLLGAIAWGPSGSFMRAILNLWAIIFSAAIIYVNTVWPATMGSDQRPCEDHNPECLKSMNYLFKPSNIPLVTQLLLNMIGLMMREGTVIHKIYAEKISTGTISDPLLP